MSDAKRDRRAYQAERSRVSQWRRFGMTPELVAAAWTAQGGVCALCPTPLHRKTTRGCHVDHCHVTNRFRGLLCGTCNLALGALGDTVEGLTRALNYVKKVHTA